MNVRDKISRYKYIWIYGAGKCGRKLLQTFSVLGIENNGIVISETDGTVIPGVQVYGLSDIHTDHAETLFIITVSSRFHEEIIQNIYAAGYEHFIIWDAACMQELWTTAEYAFTDRRKGMEKCCFLLAGYKRFLWEAVFERFIYVLPPDVEVCILSSGLYNEALEKKAEEHGWSYLSTKINSVTFIQNIAYALFDRTVWIYKMDEDIFLTKGAFEKLYQGYRRMETESANSVGISAPLIPLNGYGYIQVLKEQRLLETYEDQFGKAYIGGNPGSEIEKNPEAAVFMWDRCQRIDDLNRIFEQSGKIETCHVRFSIGFILMKRSFWLDLNGFSVSGNADMGTDEEEICAECMNHSRAIVVCHDTVVGHFSFGRQTERMRRYFQDHSERFSII